MDKLGFTTSRQLSDFLGWDPYKGPRKAARLRRGENDAQFSTLMHLLLMAGFLTEDAVKVLRPLEAEFAAASQSLAEVPGRPAASPHARDGRGHT